MMPGSPLPQPGDRALLDALFEAVHCANPVAGHTHNFYRYPARFSPQFARATIEAFTQPGDTVLDPFMGGGTSAVESQVSGRRFVGCDINPLSLFVTRAKTTPVSMADVRELSEWIDFLPSHVNIRGPNARHDRWLDYQRNLPWWLRKGLEMALDSVLLLSTVRRRRFARCTLLRTAQWALDCRQELPTLERFLASHREYAADMIKAAREFGRQLGRAFGCPPSGYWQHRRLLNRPAAGLDQDGRLPSDWLPPRLVLTSPPYVGVHVLYHRWQVQGRRETPAPYWLANCRDGRGGSHYTFGDRKRKDIDTYMSHLRDAFRSVVALLDERSVVVQLVAFTKPDTQLRPYLNVMHEVGLEETDVCGVTGSLERVWRVVPNRKWYARVKGELLPERQEVLLVHRKRSSPAEVRRTPCPSATTRPC
jgi:hypothetical protein